MKAILQNKGLIRYTATFLGCFAILFYGTEAIIGLAAPGNNYSAFVDRYLDFINPYRNFLLQASIALLSAFGVKAGSQGDILYWQGGQALRMSYSCIGYGVLGFWAAFILANRATWKTKAAWILGGSLLLCTINLVRVSLLLVALNRGWPIPFGWDHHTWFNIVCYGVIFGMIYCFDRTARNKAGKRNRLGPTTAQVQVKKKKQRESAGRTPTIL